MGKLVDMNYKHHDLDFLKGFVHDVIAASTNCQTEHTLPRRYIAVLKSLPPNNDIVISPFDKGGSFVFMDSTINKTTLQNVDKNNIHYRQISNLMA